MPEESNMEVEKVSASVNISYPANSVNRVCFLIFEEEPHWFRRRKLTENLTCDCCFIFVENSKKATPDDVLQAISFIDFNRYDRVFAISYGSSVYPLLSTISYLDIDGFGVITPNIHENASDFSSKIRKDVVGKYDSDTVRTYFLESYIDINDFVMKLVGNGGGWSREIDEQQSEKMRKETKTQRFATALANNGLRELDMCFERIVFGEI
jgi:hypothetical protein